MTGDKLQPPMSQSPVPTKIIVTPYDARFAKHDLQHLLQDSFGIYSHNYRIEKVLRQIIQLNY